MEIKNGVKKLLIQTPLYRKIEAMQKSRQIPLRTTKMQTIVEFSKSVKKNSEFVGHIYVYTLIFGTKQLTPVELVDAHYSSLFELFGYDMISTQFHTYRHKQEKDLTVINSRYYNIKDDIWRQAYERVGPNLSRKRKLTPSATDESTKKNKRE